MLGTVVIVEVAGSFVIIEAYSTGRIPSRVTSRVTTVWRRMSCWASRYLRSFQRWLGGVVRKPHLLDVGRRRRGGRGGELRVFRGTRSCGWFFLWGRRLISRFPVTEIPHGFYEVFSTRLCREIRQCSYRLRSWRGWWRLCKVCRWRDTWVKPRGE